MLNKIKLLLGLTDTSKDELITLLLESATEEVINYTHNDDLAGMGNCICQMVVYNYNRIGTEGLNSESYSGVNFNYSQSYPEGIMSQLKAHRKLQVI